MAKQSMTFEKALKQLETIVAQIEEGKVSLEESIAKYGEGIKLIGKCREILDDAEKKIQLLSRSEGASLAQAGELEEPENADDEAGDEGGE